ncbi:MAG TPA: hypothetical protein VF144_11945 [Chitinophagaceae bacterium]
MTTSLLKYLLIALALCSCATTSQNNKRQETDNKAIFETYAQPEIAANDTLRSLMDLPQTEYGGFVLKPGLYETDFKTYCLQPGTPDPRKGDAYYQGPVTGHRKEIVETVLLNSRDKKEIDQKNIQLLLWSIVSGSNFNSLPYEVQSDAMKLLTPKQIFELKGGVMGLIKNAASTSGISNSNNDILRLFETGIKSYEAYERIAVRSERSKVIKSGVKYDQWYKQKEKYYVRYFPENYKKVKIQIYVPNDLLDNENRLNGDYLVFDPTGLEAAPAYTNAQRLGVGAPVIDIVRAVIKTNRQPPAPKKLPEKKTSKPGV